MMTIIMMFSAWLSFSNNEEDVIMVFYGAADKDFR